MKAGLVEFNDRFHEELQVIDTIPIGEVADREMLSGRRNTLSSLTALDLEQGEGMG